VGRACRYRRTERAFSLQNKRERVMNPPQLSSAVVPPGGFIYDQLLADGSYYQIQGGSYDHVRELILRYRLLNGMVLAPGTRSTPDGVSEDYNAQVCGKYPWLCTPQREPLPVTVEVGGTPGFEMLIVRMGRWLDWVRSHEAKWVDHKSATERAAICAQCPQNVLWQTNCDPCNSKLVIGSAALRGARRLHADPLLRGCRAFGTLQEVAVWLEEPGGEGRYEPPPNCWRVAK